MKSAHTVQFFDSPDTLGSDVARFFAEGLAAGDALVLAARPAHVHAIAEGLSSHSVSFPDLVESGRLVLMDPAALLRRLMYNGRPNPEAFERILAAPTRQLIARTAGHVRLYGELVDMLACDDNVRASAELEDLWIAFSEQHPVHLYCGYSAANFAGARAARSMQAICRRHRHVQQNEHDLLANWLLAQHA